MDYLVLLQARCGSTRLPGKVLADLGGKPVLQRVLERVQRSKGIDEVVVVTSIEVENLPLVRLCADLGVRVFAGSEEDVLDRFYQAAKLLSPRYVVRVTGDCPVFDPTLLDRAIGEMQPHTDYLGMLTDTFPDGLDLEVFTFAALRRAWEEAELPSEREHVTLYIRNHPELFRLQDFVCPRPGLGGLRWTLDEPEDMELLRAVYSYFLAQGREMFGWEEILHYLEQNPQLARVNSRLARNEGLAKSLERDKQVEQRRP